MSIHEDDLPKQRRLTVETTSPMDPEETRTINVEVGFPQSHVSTGQSDSVDFITGPKGDPGPPGPPGSAVDVSFVFHQATPASVWEIAHPLPYIPSVTIVNSAGEEVEGDLTYGSGSTVTVSFSGAFSGTAYLS